MTLESLPAGYDTFLAQIKQRVRAAQVRAAVSVNTEMLLLYWGARVIDRLSHDLKTAFPQMQGFSPRNLKYMRAFAAAWPDEAMVQGPLAQISWYHNIALLEKLKDTETRLWYAKKALENGWSQVVLVHQIGTRLHERQGKAITNFAQTLPAPQSDLAQALLKDPYSLDFRKMRT